MKLGIITFALAASACGVTAPSSSDFVGKWTWLEAQQENVSCGSGASADAGDEAPAGTFTLSLSGNTVTMDGGAGCSIAFALDSGGLSATAPANAKCATDAAGMTSVVYQTYILALGNNAGSASGQLSAFIQATGDTGPNETDFMGNPLTGTGCTILSGDANPPFFTIALIAANTASYPNVNAD